MTHPSRYHNFLISLHWLLAAVLGMALFMGSTQLVNISNASPAKIDALRAHMIAGAVVFVLMVLRLIVRIKTVKPAPATTGNPLLDKIGGLTHIALYLLVFSMVGSGVALAVQTNLPAIVFQLSGALPANFDAFAPRLAHGVLSKLLMTLIALHAVAALYHQFIRKDNLLRRMWWSKHAPRGFAVGE